MPLPPPPDPRQLLPPLLACLPTSFVSPQPPPALLPLLSPLLRQRVAFLSSSAASSSSSNHRRSENGGANGSSDGWLTLLSWDAERASRLPAVVETIQLEPHPVSGEVELDDVPPAKYRRLDRETLHARLEVGQFGLLPVYVWCETDEHGGTGPGWKLAELRSLEDAPHDADVWSDSPSRADDDVAPNGTVPHLSSHLDDDDGDGDGDGDDDDDYWAAYDRSPGRTPAPKHSPAPHPPSAFPSSIPPATASSAAAIPRRQQQPSSHPRSAEQDYYARYAAEVQPALDPHDPDEEPHHQQTGAANPARETAIRPPSRPTGASMFPADPSSISTSTSMTNNNKDTKPVSAPRPRSSTSSSFSPVQKLEAHAASASTAAVDGNGGAGDHLAQRAIRRHISTDVKSLFRLARSAGMARAEFCDFVRREVEVLEVWGEEDEGGGGGGGED